jgi:hypothetical protein
LDTKLHIAIGFDKTSVNQVAIKDFNSLKNAYDVEIYHRHAFSSSPTSTLSFTIITFSDIAVMAPYINAHESVCETNIDVSVLKEKIGVDDVKLETTAKPPVADDFMYDFKFNHALPTTDVLGIEIPANIDAQKEAQGIVDDLSNALAKGDAQAFTDLFLDYGMLCRRITLILKAAS